MRVRRMRHVKQHMFNIEAHLKYNKFHRQIFSLCEQKSDNLYALYKVGCVPFHSSFHFYACGGITTTLSRACDKNVCRESR